MVVEVRIGGMHLAGNWEEKNTRLMVALDH
jgi:hypothetical protein